MTRTAIRARWILPVEGPPVRDAVLAIRDGRIDAVLPATEATATADAPDVAILPALVNAHTHLEFSELERPIGAAGMRFPDWIRHVMAWRREREDLAARQAAAEAGEQAATVQQAEQLAEAARLRSIQQGSRELLASGTAAVGEIATSDESAQGLAGTPLLGVTFRELIGFTLPRASVQIEAAEQEASQPPPALNLVRGLSPHAPYTARPELLEAVVQISRARRVPLAMHLAESEDELELLATGGGAFVELLQDRQAWDPAAIPRGTRPLDYLRILANSHHALAVHGNYLNDEELDYLGQHRERLTLVYCPRTHAYFGHGPYPVPQIQAAGVRLALGTDSRASNPDLSMWEELRFAVARHPEVDPLDWLAAATLNAAEALGLADQIGGLRPGKLASFIVVELPGGADDDPRACLEDGNCRLRAVWVGGREVRGEERC